jgi:uncharacterized phosphatase
VSGAGRGGGAHRMPSATRRPVTTFTLVRHGETEWNRHGRIQGSTDVPLDAAGVAQARAAAASIVPGGFDAVYASPLARALDTARILADASSLGEPEIREDLRERGYGAAEGLTGAQIAREFPHRIPGQESRNAVVRRVLPVLDELALRHPGGRVLVVTHGAVISSLMRHVTAGRLPPREHPVRNLSFHDFTHDGDAVCLRAFDVPAQAAGSGGSASAAPAAPAVVRSTSSSVAADPAQL